MASDNDTEGDMEENDLDEDDFKVSTCTHNKSVPIKFISFITHN